MHPLQHDPRTKQQIKDALYDLLYTPVENRFKARIDALIMRNSIVAGYSHNSFTYKGVMYSCDAGSPPRKWNRLLPQLRPEMDEYLADLKRLNDEERPYVFGFINQVLNSSDHLSDYLKLFPDSAHTAIANLIETCPCRGGLLSNEAVEHLRSHNKDSIDMMKRRMVANLIL